MIVYLSIATSVHIIGHARSYFGKIGSTSATWYVFPLIISCDILIGRKYVNGGYNTSFSPGYTLNKPMLAPGDMKLLDTNLKSNGESLSANS